MDLSEVPTTKGVDWAHLQWTLCDDSFREKFLASLATDRCPKSGPLVSTGTTMEKRSSKQDGKTAWRWKGCRGERRMSLSAKLPLTSDLFKNKWQVRYSNPCRSKQQFKIAPLHHSTAGRKSLLTIYYTNRKRFKFITCTGTLFYSFLLVALNLRQRKKSWIPLKWLYFGRHFLLCSEASTGRGFSSAQGKGPVCFNKKRCVQRPAWVPHPWISHVSPCFS